MISKERNPKLSPEVFMNYQVVNFTVTLLGLSEQLLEIIVRLEKPEIEEKRLSNIKSLASNQELIYKIQDDILSKLVNTRDSTILDDQDLVRFLGKSKAMSESIAISIK